MRGFWGLLISTLILSGCSLSIQKSGLEVISYPTARVFINNREVGTTPYRNNTLKPGELELRLESDKGNWAKKIRLEDGANTVVNREIGGDGELGGGYVLYFESTGDRENAGVMISSNPDRATVAIDDEIKGYTPVRITNVGEGDRKLTISFPGSESINSFVKFVNGYQLVVDADLSKQETIEEPEVETITPTPIGGGQKQVLIKETETGWLRVRADSSPAAAEVGRVTPGVKYNLLEEKSDWYKIDIGSNKSGWISVKYAEKI